jgi:N-acyl-D-amino-acid deacylase
VRAFLTLAAALLVVGGAAAEPEPTAVRSAASKGLEILRKSAVEYTVQRQCFSCHHQPLAVLTMITAKSRGFEIDEKEIERQIKHTAEHLARNRDNYEAGKGQGGQGETAGYGLLTLHAGHWKADATTSAVVEYLLRRDKDRNFWQATAQRPPTQGSPLTTTYLALAALKNFGTEAKQKQIESRFEQVRPWLLGVKLENTEDRVFHLRALKVAGVDECLIKAAASELVNQQRPDGGWAQLDTLESDAYATGSTLVALHEVAGLSTKDDVYQRGLSFLLKTQEADGTWHTRTRSRPIQTYFESGFPHGKDQFISYPGTGWATLALLLSLEPAAK